MVDIVFVKTQLRQHSGHKNAKRFLCQYPGLGNGPTGDAGHGVPLFKADPSLMQSAVEWVTKVLK
jgi:hypothetical protein